ncbi:MAG: N-acetylmuramoyl-L-alanine amidase [Prevotella sp.]|nr:N-acetylmuramoyl-L-alanine amidase [Prevotella sp.]
MKFNIIYNKVSKSILLLILAIFLPLSSMEAKKFVLVIDAGHGGKDAGCVGKISEEKKLALKYALAFGKSVERNCPDVKVVYTRTTDRFLELWQRAEIANKNKADLFLSFHINSVANGKSVRGYQTYTLGQSKTTGSKAGIKQNLEVAKRENAVISMEKDYKQHYQGFDPNSPESNILFEFIQDANMERSVELSKLMQRHVCAATGRADKGAHQNNLAVLRLTSMPGCLLELGFISNPDEERFLNAESSVALYTRGILKAFIAYKNKYFDGLDVPYRPSDIKEEKRSEPTVAVQREKQNDVKEEKKTAEPKVTEQNVKQKDEPARAEMKRSQNPTNKEADKKVVEKKVEEKKVEEKKIEEKKVEEKKVEERKAEEPKIEEKKSEEALKVVEEVKDDAPIFKVQISSGRTKRSPKDSQFKGLANVEFYEEGGLFKYTVGNSTDYNAIAQLRKEILGKFPGAFIIAFKNGVKINVNEAISEFKARKK